MKVLRSCIIVLGSIFLAGVLWLQAHHFLFYRQTVLEAPIRFEEGFSLNREFTIDTPQTYWIAIQYDEIFRSTVEVPTPRDEFTAEFQITSREQLIAKGGTATAGDWSGGGPAPWATTRDRVTRYLDSFHAEAGERYSLSLHITRLLPGIVGKNPKALVVIDWKFDEFYPLRELLVIGAGLGIGILILVERLLTRGVKSKVTNEPSAKGKKGS